MERDSVRRWDWRHHVGRLAQLLMAASMQLVIAGCGGSDTTSSAAPAPDFVVCSSTYALCTTALCSTIEGDDQNVSCNCDVTTGYSAGLTECPGVVDTSEGETVVSRYFPITSYLRCANGRPWAMCLDSPCIIDPNDSTKAACKCMILANQGAYIIVNADGDYSDTTCMNGPNSYATVVDVRQVTRYLKTHDTPLKPFPIKVFRH